jgi:ATP phosphoribosyltransferase
VLESNTRLIANLDSWQDPTKRKKIDDLAMLLQGAMDAAGKVSLMMNVRRDRLPDVVEVLPR